MLSQAFDILTKTFYDEETQTIILSQIEAIQDLPYLKNVNFKIIQISGMLLFQMNGELSDIGPSPIQFDLYFLNPIENGIRCKIIKPKENETEFNPIYNSQLGFIDFTLFFERTDTLIEILQKMRQKFLNEYPYAKSSKDLQKIMTQFDNNLKIRCTELNSINQFLIEEMIKQMKIKACLKQLIYEGQDMINELQSEKKKLIEFKNEYKDKKVDESNILKLVSITCPYQKQLVEVNARILSIRDTLRLVQHDFLKNHISYTELTQYIKNFAAEEFEAQLLFKKCIKQQQQ